MTRVLFLRHGESAHNAHSAAEPLGEQEGDRLTERGLEQARAAGIALAGQGITRLLSSPLRRARETAAAVGEGLGLEPIELAYAHELHAGESFEGAIARVRRLKRELEAGGAGELPLLVTHGIFTRFFLLDSLLGEDFAAPLAGRIWQLGSHNCGLTTFAHGETRDPAGTPVGGWVCLTWMARPWDPP
ncbi:MAG TPA: histidine phosphatase family protein [Solirubrobacterales bacterium]|nr:histidine phosphatase family protein [Solirubrobacterales bacterium]